MEYGAIDLHLKASLIRIVDEDGAVVLDRTIATTRAALTEVFAGRAPLRVLVESGTESEWVAQTVEACGHEVIVADPNYALMYGHRSRRIKTDHRDVAALAEACRLGIYRAAHRVSAAQRARRRVVRVREQLVRMRTQTINLLRAQLRQEGIRLAAGERRDGGARASMRWRCRRRCGRRWRRCCAVLTSLAPLIAAATRRGAAHAASADPVVRRLMTVPGVGPVTALTFRAALDTWERFARCERGDCVSRAGAARRQLRHAAPERRRSRKPARGRCGRCWSRPAWVVWRQRQGRAALHAWVERLAERRGRASRSSRWRGA